MAEQSSWVPWPSCSLPRRPFPIKSLALPAHVSPWTIHIQVLDKSPLSGHGRGSPFCNRSVPGGSEESQPCWHLGFRYLTSWTVRGQCLLLQPLGLWHFVRVVPGNLHTDATSPHPRGQGSREPGMLGWSNSHIPQALSLLSGWSVPMQVQIQRRWASLTRGGRVVFPVLKSSTSSSRGGWPKLLISSLNRCDFENNGKFAFISSAFETSVGQLFRQSNKGDKQKPASSLHFWDWRSLQWPCHDRCGPHLSPLPAKGPFCAECFHSAHFTETPKGLPGHPAS